MANLQQLERQHLVAKALTALAKRAGFDADYLLSTGPQDQAIIQLTSSLFKKPDHSNRMGNAELARQTHVLHTLCALFERHVDPTTKPDPLPGAETLTFTVTPAQLAVAEAAALELFSEPL